jgi:hypothetical protein
MSRKLALMILAGFLPLPAEVPKQSAQVVTTDQAEFAAGGTIRIEGSTGELNIEGWDEPRVELTVTRSDWVGHSAAKHEKATRKLNDIHVALTKNGSGELVVSTARHRSMNINLDYRIMVPRNSRLVIRHHTGDVVIDGVDADIDADAPAGDIALLLPYSGHYAIDARCRVGTIYSDFTGDHHRLFLTGERFSESSAGGSRRILLRVGIGGIEIQKMGPYETDDDKPAGT